MQFKNISLIGLLAMVTCVALAVSHTITSLRLSRANEELTRLRDRLALFDVPDTNVVAARSLPSTNPHSFRWAIRLPPGVGHKLCLGTGDVSPNGLPLAKTAATRSVDIVPDPATREAFVEFSFVEGERGYGALHLDVSDSKSVIAVRPEIAALFTGDTEFTQSSVGDNPVSRRADSPVVLFLRRSTKLDNHHAKGLVLWLQPSK